MAGPFLFSEHLILLPPPLFAVGARMARIIPHREIKDNFAVALCRFSHTSRER